MMKLLVLDNKTFTKLRNASFLEQLYGRGRVKIFQAINKIHKLFVGAHPVFLDVIGRMNYLRSFKQYVCLFI